MLRRTSHYVKSQGPLRYLAAALLWTSGFTAALADTQSVQSIAAAARQFLAQQSGNGARIAVDDLDARLRLPGCERTLEAAFAPGARPAGRTNVAVRCRGSRPWMVYVPATIHILERVVVARRSLPRGATLTPDDVAVQERESSGYTSTTTLRDVQHALGQQLTRALAEGAALTTDMLSPPLLVRRGAQVVIRAQAADFEVSMPGQALGDGREGGRVRVKNLKSQRIVEGYVMADGSVQVPM